MRNNPELIEQRGVERIHELLGAAGPAKIRDGDCRALALRELDNDIALLPAERQPGGGQEIPDNFLYHRLNWNQNSIVAESRSKPAGSGGRGAAS
jgi:hypothetical protein